MKIEWIIVAGLLLLAASLAKGGNVKWQFLPGGVSIDPAGNYWKDGVMVWSPAMDNPTK